MHSTGGARHLHAITCSAATGPTNEAVTASKVQVEKTIATGTRLEISTRDHSFFVGQTFLNVEVVHLRVSLQRPRGEG